MSPEFVCPECQNVVVDEDGQWCLDCAVKDDETDEAWNRTKEEPW